MLTVAIDVGPLHGPRTGIGNAVAWSLDELRRQGAGWGDGDRLEDVEDAEVRLLPYLTSMRSRPSAPTRRLPLPAAAAHRLWQRADRPRLDRWLGRPDLVHGTNYVVPPTRCPRLVSVYDCWFLEHPAEASPDVARAGEILRRSIERGAHVVTSSHATAQRLRELVAIEHIDVIHLGPPPLDAVDRAHAGSSDLALPSRLRHLHGASFVVSIGTVERRKNVPSLVRAFTRLAAEHPTARLVIAGRPGDDQPAVDRAIGSLDAATRARIDSFGQISADEKRWLLAHAGALAYPSLDEGFGFPILEAQQAGVPVVASSAGSIPEVAGTGALLSAPLDTEALAANLHWVLTSDRQRHALVDKGTRNLDRFSWTTTARSYFDLYARLATP